ncbi:MAG: hypothetical protein M0R80_07955 [Proteobacteria bacterium]|jgi:hypothetical protein|nr:hypothetical protein [Pseudomonadota bacterium]
MKLRTLWQVSVCMTEPVVVAWEATFLHHPTHDQIKEAIRHSIAEESRLSQTDNTIHEMAEEYEIPEDEITDAMDRHMKGLVWLLKQEDLIFDLSEEVVWEA